MTKPNWTPTLSDVTPHWAKAVAQAGDSVVAFFPYVTSIQVINKIPADIPLDLYTVFSIENFASGASSFQVLQKIFKRPNTRIYHLDGLHAKLFFVDGTLISLGSQNLTARGAKNLEATVLHPGCLPTQRQRAALEAWKAAAVLLTQPMLDEMAKWLPECQKAHAAYREDLSEAGGQIASALIKFTKERQDFEKALLLANQNFESRLEIFKKELSSTSRELTRDEAELLCYDCAEVGNRYGYSRATKFHQTIFCVDDEGWCWNNSGERGTIKVCLDRAHRTAIECARLFYGKKWWEKYSIEVIQNWFRDLVGKSCVLSNIDKPFENYVEGPKQTPDYYTFGKDRFAVCDFAKHYMKKFGIPDLYRDWNSLQSLSHDPSEDSHAT